MTGDRPTHRTVLRFAAPMVLASVVALAAEFAVMALLGRLHGPVLYLRALYAPIAFLFLAVNTGLSTALQVAAAGYSGRGERGRIPEAMGGTVLIGGSLYLLLGAALLAARGRLMALAGIGAEHRTAFLHFLLAMVLVSAVAFTGDLCGAVLRATGATGRAALLTLVWVCLSIGGVAGLGNLGGLGLAALIWSLAVAALAQAGLGLALLHRRGLLTRHSAGRLRSGIGPLAVRVALPVGGSYLLLFAVNLAQLAVLAPYGPETVAGFTLGYTLQGVVIVPALAFGSAVAVLVNRHASAGREDLARGALRRGTELAVAGYGALAVLLWAAGDRLALLTGDPRTAAETARFMGEVGPTFSCTALTLVVFAVLEQTGRGPVTVVLNAVYFAVVLGLGAWLTARWHDPLGLYRVLAVGAVLGMLSGGGIGLRVLRRRVVSAALVGASGGPDAATGPVAAAGGPG